MFKATFALSILFCVTVQLRAQCTKTYKITFISSETKKQVIWIENAKLMTGSQLWFESHNEIFKKNGGRNIFVVIWKNDKPTIISKIKAGTNAEIKFCGYQPCEVICDVFSSFDATDIYGTKAHYELLSFK